MFLAKMKSQKKTKGRFGERRGVRRSIVAGWTTAITKKNRREKESLLRWSYKRRYSSHIAAFFSTVAIVSTQNDVFIAVGLKSAIISKLPPLKHIYCSGFMFRRCRTPQKTIPIVIDPKNATIDPIYSGGFYTCRKKTATIVQISCRDRICSFLQIQVYN